MAIQGTYRINYTDPKNGNFVIEPYTVDGNVNPTTNTLHPRATKASTSLQLPGQYSPNYGELINENLVHLLENFAGGVAPLSPTAGQLWYDTGDSYEIVDVLTSGCVVAGNQSAVFSRYLTDAITLSAWYGAVSTVDNSPNVIDFKITSIAVSGATGNTEITGTTLAGGPVAFPGTAIGGVIILKQNAEAGRLKIATGVDGGIEWRDVVSIVCADEPPIAAATQDTGLLWFDTNVGLWKVLVDGIWESPLDKYLPLLGGTMTGPINMGNFPVTFTGPVLTNTTLVNKLYVDTVLQDAIEDVTTGGDAALGSVYDRLDTIEGGLPHFITKDSDNVRGSLVFGADGSVSSIPVGIDMANRPIVNPTITWSASDYLTAIGETHHVVDKQYVGLALQQHLDDSIHGQPSFIVEDVDTTGLIVNDIHFADGEHTLTWRVNSTTYGLRVLNGALVLSTGDFLGDAIEFRTNAGVSGNPFFQMAYNQNRSFLPLYIHDGQPQPTAGGAPTDVNDDTAAATKGFVRSIASAPSSEVTGATFTYNVTDLEYPLTLEITGDSDVTVDINHEHSSTRIIHQYSPLDGWVGGEVDLVGEMLDTNTTPSLNVMLDALNSTKAPINGAVFYDHPKVGRVYTVTDIEYSIDGLAFGEPTLTIPVGYEITTTNEADVTVVYTVTGEEIVDEEIAPDPEFPEDTVTVSTRYFTVEPALPPGIDLDVTFLKVTLGYYTPADELRALVNRATLEYELRQLPPPPTIPPAPVSILLPIGNETAPLATAANVFTFRLPHDVELSEVRASLTTAQATGSVLTVDVLRNGVSIFGANLITVDNTEKTSKTATVPAILATTALTDDDEITVSITQVGDGTATGLKIMLIGTK